MSESKLLIVVTGPTAVGKTSLGIRLAEQFHTEIISCDSRQFYKEMQIGTAVPSAVELAAVPHHFIGFLSITEPYDVSRYETDALKCLDDLFKKHQAIILAGGSGLYIDAVCRGFDELPDRDPVIRKNLLDMYRKLGLAALQEQVRRLDPEYYAKVDRNNPNRLLRAIEVCTITGKSYSSLRKGKIQKRPFQILKIGLNRERQELFERIATRTEAMIAAGLVDEARRLLPYRYLNALNTVGYKEIFEFFDGNMTLVQAIENIKTNTRRYAKRQLTWCKKDPDYQWFHPDKDDEIIKFISNTFDSSDRSRRLDK